MATKEKLPQKREPHTQPKLTTVGEQIMWLTVQDYAKVMRICDDTVRKSCERGEVPGAMRFGCAWRIPIRKEARSC